MYRVAPVLKEQVDGGKINLTAIVNTHQFVPLRFSHSPGFLLAFGTDAEDRRLD